MKRLLATSLLFISFLIQAQEPWGCTHHDYKEGQKVYSWKFNGIKMRSTPVVSSPNDDRAMLIDALGAAARFSAARQT